LDFSGNILIIGYGAVCKCMLPLLFRHINISPADITIIDSDDKTGDLKDWTCQGLRFFQRRVTEKNLEEILAAYLSPGGLLIDLAYNIDCCEIIKWCHDNFVLYINASVEVWDPFIVRLSANPYEKSLYYRQMKIREITKDWNDSVTCVVDHGANPGLISHFAKQGLIDIANKMIFDGIAKEPERLEELVKEENFARIAMEIGIKVIHCSERDTQVSKIPKEPDEFVGTWCVEGLIEEGTAPAEMGWGIHEKEYPGLTFIPPSGPKNEVFLAKMGMNTWVRSWIPNQEIVGMAIRHGETYGISDRWTVWKEGRAIYRPSVYYAYVPCDATVASLHELRGRNYELPPKFRIMNDAEIISGADILGALLMGHPYQSWWTGSILSIEEARTHAPGQNATTLQVSLGVIAAVMWMIENPRRGFCLPDDLPYKYILDIAKPYLGTFHSGPADWNPLKNRMIYFKENPENIYDYDDIWQFKNFLFVQ